VLWAIAQDRLVVELLPAAGPPPDPASGVTRVDAGGIAVDLPSLRGRELATSGKPIGVAELGDGSWVVTTSTGHGGVDDPDTGQKVRSSPDAHHRRYIEPLRARSECVLAAGGAGGAAGSCP
jgi:hypothetical protein